MKIIKDPTRFAALGSLALNAMRLGVELWAAVFRDQ